MDPPPTIGVVIVSWNVAGLLRRCLLSLAAQSRPLAVVVVDNASTDGTADMLAKEFQHVRRIENRANVGFTAANNQGLQALGLDGTAGVPPDLVLLLNPDTEIAPGALDALERYLATRPNVGLVGPVLRNPDGSVQSSRRRLPTLATAVFESTPIEWLWPTNPVARRYRMADVRPDQAGIVDWVTGAAMLVRARALAEVGPFDEGFFMYSEELDLCRRLRAVGWEVGFEPRAEVVHHEGASSIQVSGRRLLWFHRSRVRYFRKYHGAAAARLVQGAVLLLFSAAWVAEAGKLALGHKKPLRRARLQAYAALWREGISGAEPAS
jgi:N-acetylglucosaminyl-diphospho-decaprenol L-rhamnosyltransferase